MPARSRSARSFGLELDTMSSRDPGEARRRAIHAVIRTADADSGVFYSVVEVGGGMRYGTAEIVADPLLEAQRASFVGSPWLPTPMLDVARPRAIEVSTFTELSSRMRVTSEADMGSFPVYDTVYRRCGVFSDIRLLVYSGDLFVGWIGAFRRKGPHFGSSERRRLRPLVEPVRGLLRAADALEGRADGQVLPFFIVTPEGAVSHATDEGARWLTVPSRAEALREAVRAADRARAPSRQTRAFMGRAEACITRLDAIGAVTYVVTFTPARPARKGALAELTPAQARVAELAATGATVNEMAIRLGSARETVRRQLADVYSRLEVQSRAELATRVAGRSPGGGADDDS